jgi:hypothetical protein
MVTDFVRKLFSVSDVVDTMHSQIKWPYKISTETVYLRINHLLHSNIFL